MKENLGLKEISAEQAAMVERIYREWDRAWSNDDLEAMLALYAADAVLESPLIPHLLGTSNGFAGGGMRFAHYFKRLLLESRGNELFIAGVILRTADC
jgi:ketosteroid isomerase-like protein